MEEEQHIPTRSERHHKKTHPSKEDVHRKKKKEKARSVHEDSHRGNPDHIWDDDPRPPVRVRPVVAAVLLLMLAFAGAAFGQSIVHYLFPASNRPAQLGDTPIEPMTPEEEKALNNINILVLGCDEREGEKNARADVIMVATLRPEDKKVAIFSIPRDTYVSIPNHGKDKINHSMAYGGIPLITTTAENLLDIKIDHAIKINFDGFINVIDALGGIHLEVERRMYKPLESIDLYPGEQTLMGKDALAYVRWRGDGNGDYGRIERQQKFLAALTEKVKGMSLKQALNVASAVMDSIETDMSIADMTSYGLTFRSISAEDVKTYSFVGDPMMMNNISYVKPNMTAIKEIVEKMQYGEPEETVPADNENGADGNQADSAA